MVDIEGDDDGAPTSNGGSSEEYERACDGQDAEENHAQYLREEEDNLEVQENLRRFLEEDYNGTVNSRKN